MKRAHNTVIIRPPAKNVYSRHTREEWYKRCEETYLWDQCPCEIWQNIAKNLNVQDYLALSQICVGAYHNFGGFKHIIDVAIETKDETCLQKMKQTAMPGSVLFHSIHWSLLTDDWNWYESFENRIRNHFEQHNMTPSMPREYPVKFIIGGGYARAMILNMFQAHHIQVPEELSNEYKDIDLWLPYWWDPHHMPNHLLPQEVLGNTRKNEVDCFLDDWRDPKTTHETVWNKNVEWIHNNCVTIQHQPVPIQVIHVQYFDNPEDFYQLITQFDFTSTQIAITGGWNNSQVYMTPGFAYSLLTGAMWYTHGHHADVNWPLVSTTAELDKISGKIIIGVLEKANLVQRLYKYQAYGYHDMDYDTPEKMEQLKVLIESDPDFKELVNDMPIMLFYDRLKYGRK